MTTLKLLVASLLLAAAPAQAFDLGSVKTKSILGLEGPTQGAKIKPTVFGVQPLETEGVASLAGRSLRTRYWKISGPDGIVPIHEHSNRPAMFTIASGEVVEYSSAAEEPITHKAGGLAIESGELAHWWENKGTEVVRLIAFDLQPVAKDFAAVEVSTTPEPADFKLPEAKGAQNDLLGVVDLGQHFKGAYGKGWALTTYRATIDPGGVLPDFTATGEPLQTFVWTGSVTEHRSDSKQLVEIKVRTGTNLAGGASAYWENTGDTVAIIYFGVVEPTAEVEGVKRVGVLAHGSH